MSSINIIFYVVLDINSRVCKTHHHRRSYTVHIYFIRNNHIIYIYIRNNLIKYNNTVVVVIFIYYKNYNKCIILYAVSKY